MLDYQKQQANFAAHLRNPQHHLAPENVEARRLKIYQELFFNNIHGFISSGFPVLKSLFEEELWNALIRDFFANHKAQTPYFLEISEEFLMWLQDDSLPIHKQFPFARELAHYEWVELGLDVAEVDLPDKTYIDGDLFSALPVISPLAWPLVYSWPVHMISSRYLPQMPAEQPVCLIVYRNRDDQVEFLEANAITLRMLELLDDVKYSNGEQVLRQLATEIPNSDEDTVIMHGVSTLQQLTDLGIILGTRG